MKLHKVLLYDTIPKLVSKGTDLFPFPYRVGIEVELEGVSSAPNSNWWSTVGDGSLKKSGLELISRTPISGDEIDKSLNDLRAFLAVQKQVEAGPRTSIHIHVDVIDMNLDQLINYLLLYTIMEKVLYSVGGIHRYKNNNCQPLGCSPQFTALIGKLIKIDEGGKNTKHDFSSVVQVLRHVGKYCGCNTHSIVKGVNGQYRGSLEFRMHEGTTDVERISKWVQLLLKLKNYAMTEFNRNVVFEQFSLHGPLAFMHECLGDSLYEYVGVITDQYDFTEDLYDGVRNAEFAVHYEDVEQLVNELVKEPEVVNSENSSLEVVIEDLDDLDEDDEEYDPESMTPQLSVGIPQPSQPGLRSEVTLDDIIRIRRSMDQNDTPRWVTYPSPFSRNRGR